MSKIFATFAAVCLNLAVLCACASDGQRALPTQLEGEGNLDDVDYEPCDIGDTKDCTVTLGEHNGVLSCYHGTATCGENGWGDCVNGDVANKKAPLDAPDKRLLAVKGTDVCVENPCDPKCELFGDRPDAAAPDPTTLTRTPKFDWETGSLAGFPGGLVNKGLREPCSSGSDCQFNSYCTNPVSGGCSHSKCDVGLPLDPTCDACVTDICQVKPECCAVNEEEAAACEHNICTVGNALKETCDPCVEQICANSPECCDNKKGAWDESCVQQVQTTCGLTCECCDGEVSYNGHCYYLETSNQSWSDARNACLARGDGWDLVSIGDANENDFVYNLNSSNDTWIGLTEAKPFSNKEGSWVWTNGDPDGSWDEKKRSGIYDNFRSSEPDSSSDACARIHDNRSGKWGDRACTRNFDSVCEGAPSCLAGGDDEDSGLCNHDPCQTGDALSESCDVCTQAVCQTMPSCCTDAWTQDCVDLIATECEAECECRDEEPEFNGHCYFAERNNRDWTTARTSCQSRGPGWDLASVSSDAENDFLSTYNGAKDTWIGLTNGQGLSSGSKWAWTNGDPDGHYDSSTGSGNYQNFASSEPNGSGECVRAMANSGWQWADTNCGNTEDSMCEGPKSQLSQKTPVDGSGGPAMWSEQCVDLVESVCDAKCNESTTGAGECSPWYPGQVDENVPGIDLAVGPPCEQIIPVCNHGQTDAPAGIRIVHFPANAQQYPKCQPDQSHPQMYECTTEEPVPSGECIMVEGCPQLIGNREIMVNPEGPDYVEEFSCRDNWSLYSKKAETCEPPVCSGGTSIPVSQDRPVDIMFIVDNSGSMEGEIKQVQQRINTDFSSLIAASGVDYRVIMMSRYGDTDTSVGFSRYPVCVQSPLGADDCSSAASTPLSNNPPDFFHYSADIGSWDTLCRVLEGFDSPDELARDGRSWTPLAPFGYSQWLRQGSLKVFVAVTDDDVDCFHQGVLLRDDSTVSGGESAAETFDTMLLNLSPEHFGTADSRDYVWHSIVGLTEYSDPLEAWPPADPIQTSECSPGSQGPGTGYQALSRMTDGLRYPICRNDDFDAIFQKLAEEVINDADASCSFDLQNQGEFDIRLATVLYHPGDGSDPLTLIQADSLDSCEDGKWYVDDPSNPTQVLLCPATCERLKQDSGARVGLEIGCEGGAFEPFSFSQVYEAECEYDEVPQWGMFSFQVTTPADSSIVFRIRSAETEAGLADASFTELVTVSTANGNEDCTSPTVEGCPVDLYEALNGRPNAHHPFIEIEGGVNPSSDGLQLPSVESWELTFSCPDAQ